ncbi:MAG: substrate-binding domain-containing protein [Chitinophagaceae bacterium]
MGKLYTIALMFCLVLMACHKNSKQKQYVIGFSQSGEADSWRRTMLEEMNRELFFHPNLKMFYRETRDNVPEQIAQVKDLLDQGIDILIICATDARQLEPAVSKVYRSGIPVIVLDRNIASQDFTSHIGADNKEIGAIAGKYIANLLDGKGNILEITGKPSSSPAMDRSRGFDSIVAQHPQLHVVHRLDGEWTSEEAASRLRKADSELSSIDAVFAHNDLMAGAARRVMDSLSIKKVPIVGVDALPGAGLGLDMVQKGILTGSIIYPTGGKEAIRNAALLVEGKHLPRQTVLKTVLVDSGNVETVEMQVDKIASQQDDIRTQQEMIQAQRKIYKNQRTYITVLFVFVLLLLAAAILLWYSRVLNKKINMALYAKNRDIHTKNEQIRQMSIAAEEMHEAKINFFTKISHEFRTPLSLIIAPLEEMLANPRLAKESKTELTIMRKNAYRLLQLVTQLMDLRKIEFGKFRLQVDQEDVLGFAQEVLRSFDSLAKQRHISTRVSSSSRYIRCYFDAYIVEKILLNLLSNAFKYTPDGGDIWIEVKEDRNANKIIFAVEDTGTGMDEESKKNLFSFFHDNGRQQKQSNGIGLHLVRELALLHHGEVSIDSKLHVGTKVVFAIPLEYDYSPQEMFLKQESVLETEPNSKMYAVPLAQTPSAPSRGGWDNPLESGKQKTVLVVEDNDDLRMLVQRKLSENYYVVTASDGKTAVKALYEQHPDIVVCDVMLPDMDGLEITRRCRGDVKTSFVPIILLTAHSSSQQQMEGLKRLANAYISKPFHMDILVQTIDNLLANNALLKEHYTSLGNTHVQRIADTNDSPNGNSHKPDRKFVTEFTSIVAEHLSNEQLNVQMLCDLMHVSRIQLYRKVKLYLKTNVNEYILSARILKAKSYLMEDEYSIAEIASKTGFATPSYFSTVFKKMTGSSPSEFIGKKGK